MKNIAREKCSFCGKYVDFIIRKEATLLREAQWIGYNKLDSFFKELLK